MSDTLTGATAATTDETNPAAAAAAPATNAAAGDPAAAAPASGDTGAGKEEEPKTGAPEKYEDFTLPEGIELDQAAMEGFLPVAKELNLTQEQAQKLVDLQTAYVKNAADAQAKAWDKQLTEWADAARADKEF